MASATATVRLQREHRDLCKDPPPHVQACPNPSNILEWHYVLDGPPGSPYEGGQYWGKLVFPAAYPFKPPSVLMLTPNGRFQPNTRICMSMSDYHPETWNPLWSVSSILTGLLSFMCDSAMTAGSLQTSASEKRRLAKSSRAYNSKTPAFKKMFPDLVDKPMKEKSARNEETESNGEENHSSNGEAKSFKESGIRKGTHGGFLQYLRRHHTSLTSGLFLLAGVTALLAYLYH